MSNFTEVGVACTGSTAMIGCGDDTATAGHSFEQYIDLLWTVVCILSLLKLTQFSEWYFNKRLLIRKNYNDICSMNREWEHTLQLHEDDKRQLFDEVRMLTKKNLHLDQMIKDLRDCNIHLITENLMRTVLQEQKQQSQSQPNIYITNSFFQLTRELFINDSCVDCNVRSADGQDICPSEVNEEGLNIWMQYLKMRKCYMGPIADPNLVAPNSPEPLVMTTEQLAKMQGII